MYERKMVQIRMNVNGIAKLDEIAESNGVNRSDVMRACFALAFADPSKIADYLARRKQDL